MDAWVWWLVAALVLAIGETATLSLVLAMASGGALAAAVTAALGAPVGLQFVVFALVSLALILGVRPVARRHLHQPALSRSGAAALVGTEAYVLEAVGARDGRVKLAGEVWSARAYDGESSYQPGALVYVVQIDGATALVAER